MAKTIKFNLNLNDNPVRTLDNLRNNFCVEDMLGYYHNGLLARWLDVRGCHNEKQGVDAISAVDDIEIVKRLVKLFEVEVENAKIEEAVASLAYEKEKKEMLSIYGKQTAIQAAVIEDYFAGYYKLIQDIIDNKDDMPKIKAAVAEIVKSYFLLFAAVYRTTFYTMLQNAPMACFAMLMQEKMREFLILQNSDAKTPSRNTTELPEYDVAHIYRHISSINLDVLNDNLKTFTGNTDGTWDEIEENINRRFMILSLSGNAFVRSRNRTEKLSASDIINKFLILEGVEFNSQSAEAQIQYVEV
jgi:hypothetical protein